MNPTIPAVLLPVPCSEVKSAPAPRLRCADRQQLDPQPRLLDDLIEAEHRARVVWAVVEALDLTVLYDRVRAVEGQAGRRATDARISGAVVVGDGGGSRQRPTGSAVVSGTQCLPLVVWGRVGERSHAVGLSGAAGEWLEAPLTWPVAALLAEGLVDLKRTAQDGVRVRASAGAASFRRNPTLEKCLQEAEAHLAALRQQQEENPTVVNKRQQAAPARAARERQARIAEALKHVAEVEAKKKAEDKKKACRATTEPEARVMKMADGGFRPAYNGQFCTATESQLIVGVAVSNLGSDQGQMAPRLDPIADPYGQYPDEALVDGGFVNKADLEYAASPAIKVTVYAPVPKPKDPTRDPYQPLPTDTPALAQWRQRMGTDEAKAIYKARAATAEGVNAIARNRGLQQFRVRGLKKVKAMLLWFALAHNVRRAVALRLQAVASPA